MKGGNKFLYTGAGLIAAFALFFAFNVVSNQSLRDARLDLTQARLFTLSEGTRNVLKSVQEPITLRFFFSEKISNQAPQIKQYGLRVRELLERYAALAGGRVKLEVIDPEPFSEAEDRAVAAGIQAVSLGGQGSNFYFGLVGSNSIDQQETIPFFQPDKEQFLEYDLTKLVYALTNPKKPVIGIVGSLPLEFGPGGVMAAMRGQSQPYMVLQQIKQFFDVKVMLEGKPEQIDDKLDVLLLAHPKDLSDEMQYAIDQFVLRGGRLIVFADPYSETAAAMPNPMTGQPMPVLDSGSLLPKLFKAWGVEVDGEHFVADLALAQRVQTGRSGAQAVVDYLPWLAISPAQMNPDDVITAQLTGVNVASAGSIRRAEGATTTMVPLIRSSDKAMLMPVKELRGDPNPQALAEAFKPTGDIYTLAARITGPARTAFPDGPPAAKEAPQKDGEAKPAAAPQLKESAKPINVVLIADADLLDDRFWVRVQNVFGQQVAVPMAANADMVVNAIDNMSGSGDLIGLRSRGKSQRPFEKIDSMRREAERQFLARERALQKRMDDTEKQLAELQGKAQGSTNALITAEQQAAIDNFRADLLNTRKELRNVQRELNRDIEAMQLVIKFINIGLMPLLAAVVAIMLGVAWRRRRVARRLEG